MAVNDNASPLLSGREITDLYDESVAINERETATRQRTTVERYKRTGLEGEISDLESSDPNDPRLPGLKQELAEMPFEVSESDASDRYIEIMLLIDADISERARLIREKGHRPSADLLDVVGKRLGSPPEEDSEEFNVWAGRAAIAWQIDEKNASTGGATKELAEGNLGLDTKFSLSDLEGFGIDISNFKEFFGDLYQNDNCGISQLAFYLSTVDDETVRNVLESVRQELGDEVAKLLESLIDLIAVGEFEIDDKDQDDPPILVLVRPAIEELSDEQILEIVAIMVNDFLRYVSRSVTSKEHYNAALKSFTNGIAICFGEKASSLFKRSVPNTYRGYLARQNPPRTFGRTAPSSSSRLFSVAGIPSLPLSTESKVRGRGGP